MADLDIAERRIPQDGRIGLTVGGRPIDMRVASLPTVYGEKVVIRLLDRSNVMLRLEELGLLRAALSTATAARSRSHTAPSWSPVRPAPGKSTTLYATLNILNTRDKNIITVEDPVEYRLAGINQVQINPKAGLTFASGLRSILRCDPDIVMVGEVRDKETAQIAIESALTGHLVLSTLHTNDAPGRSHPAHRDGCRALPDRVGRGLRDRPEAGPQALRVLPGAVHTYPGHPSSGGLHQRRDRRAGTRSPSTAPSVVLAATTPATRAAWAIYEIMLVTEAIERLIVERKSADEIGRVATSGGHDVSSPGRP